MADRDATAHKISSFAAPTDQDFARFKGLSREEQIALLRAEIDKGSGGLSRLSFDEIVAAARGRCSDVATSRQR